MPSKIGTFCIWAALIAAPFFVSTLPIYVEDQKALAIRVLLIAALGAALCDGAARRRVDGVFAGLAAAYAAWLLAGLIAHGANGTEVRAVLDRVLAVLAIFLFAREGERAARYALWIAIGAAAMGAYAFLVRYAPAGVLPFKTTQLIGAYTHPNLLAQHLAVAAPAALGLFYAQRTKEGRRFYLLLFSVLLIPLLLTYTRGAILAFGGAAVLCRPRCGGTRRKAPSPSNPCWRPARSSL
ncbi:MAG: hypothetical protein M5R36_28000 [Deltaproteobacteria bacterium]|nr:hypothetical protein [Deltaproteobacteria bacterium]